MDKGELNQKRILVVDDEEEIVEMLKINLERKNYRVSSAYNGKQAIDLVHQTPPDLILLDFMLPAYSGPEVADKLKTMPATADIPIIFLTARSDNDSIITGLKTGAADYITKPFNISELLVRIETQLKLKDALDKLKQTENELRIVNDIKDKFFTVFIHDIRQPIHSLNGFIRILHDRYDRMEEEKRVSVVQTIKDSSMHLQNLIENMLQWSQIQSGLFEWTPQSFNLWELIAISENLFAEEIRQKGINITIDIDDSIHVYADKSMVGSIIRNLLQNAIKYTPDKGFIQVCSQRIGKFEQITISDSGVGIRAEDLKEIFDLKQRHSTTGLHGEKGSGMGLALCNEFVMINGGEMSVESTPGAGSDFRFTLPLA